MIRQYGSFKSLNIFLIIVSLNFANSASTTRVALFSHCTHKLLAKLPVKLLVTGLTLMLEVVPQVTCHKYRFLARCIIR